MSQAQRVSSALSPALRENLRGWLRNAAIQPGALVLLVILAALPLVIKDPYIQRLLAVSLLFGAQAMVFDFTGGFINAVNFGFAAFVGLGAYTSGLLAVNFGISPWIGMLAGALAAGLVGFITGALTLPLRGVYVSIMAWFVGMTLMAMAYAMVDVTRGAQGINVPYLLETPDMLPYYYILLAITAVIYVILRLMIQSRIGLAFKAIGQNFEAARASGIDPTRYKLINFTLSCACAGLLGGYYAHFVGVLTPGMMVTDNTIKVMALSYIGGAGTLLGGLITSFLITPIFDYLKGLMEFRLIIYGMLLILTMILYPAGLHGFYLWGRRSIHSLRNRNRQTHENR
jgi:branched-chain amino acid transport system permease protein